MSIFFYQVGTSPVTYQDVRYTYSMLYYHVNRNQKAPTINNRVKLIDNIFSQQDLPKKTPISLDSAWGHNQNHKVTIKLGTSSPSITFLERESPNTIAAEGIGPKFTSPYLNNRENKQNYYLTHTRRNINFENGTPHQFTTEISPL